MERNIYTREKVTIIAGPRLTLYFIGFFYLPKMSSMSGGGFKSHVQTSVIYSVDI